VEGAVKELKIVDCDSNSSIFNHEKYYKVNEVLSVINKHK